VNKDGENIPTLNQVVDRLNEIEVQIKEWKLFFNRKTLNSWKNLNRRNCRRNKQ